MKPPTKVMKIDFDVNVNDKFSTLVVMARDKEAKVLYTWAKVHVLCDPMQTEVATILWALQLAQAEDLHIIIVEGDAKSRFNALN